MPGILYIVGTPIGNLGDVTPRALEVLNGVDFVAAEDTRVTIKLFNKFGIKKGMESYYEYNAREKGEKFLARMLAGESCALVSDAGMPCISDPGGDLVSLCLQNGVEVRAVPGATAAISALCISGLDCSRFCFEGFLSVNKKSRFYHLESLKEERRTMVFYEAPHKLLRTLRDMLEAFGDREISIARELTKRHEEVKKTTLSAAVGFYREHEPKGEFVLVIRGKEAVAPAIEAYSPEDAVELARELMNAGAKPGDAAQEAARRTGLKRNEIYRLLVNPSQNSD